MMAAGAFFTATFRWFFPISTIKSRERSPGNGNGILTWKFNGTLETQIPRLGLAEIYEQEEEPLPEMG